MCLEFIFQKKQSKPHLLCKKMLKRMAELFLLICFFSNIENQCCHFGLFSFSYHQQPWVYNELIYASLLCKGMNILIHTAEKKVLLHFKNKGLLDQTILTCLMEHIQSSLFLGFIHYTLSCIAVNLYTMSSGLLK